MFNPQLRMVVQNANHLNLLVLTKNFHKNVFRTLHVRQSIVRVVLVLIRKVDSNPLLQGRILNDCSSTSTEEMEK